VRLQFIVSLGLADGRLTCHTFSLPYAGNCTLNSWIADNEDRTESCRMLTVQMKGVSGDIHRESAVSRMENNIED